MGASTFFNVVETSTAVPLLLQIRAERVLQRVPHRNDGSHTYRKKPPGVPGGFCLGGPSRIRTLDLLIKSQLLYQLS
ncbi:conserved protein of unknown function [Stenotrophomonas maltophilia]|nr:conserved protein of unknown function [Stenotrophomonas maltophilia]